MLLLLLLLNGLTVFSAQDTEEDDSDTVRMILGSSVVTSVSVILDNGNGSQTYFADAVGKPVSRPASGSQLASPINLLNPDRYEFFTFDDNGELVKRLMTLEEIQGIIANGDGEDAGYSSNATTYAPEKRVDDIVSNVQNVLKEEIELHKNSSGKRPVLDTPDVSSSWSMILPAIFGNSGEDIVPERPPTATPPDLANLSGYVADKNNIEAFQQTLTQDVDILPTETSEDEYKPTINVSDTNQAVDASEDIAPVIVVSIVSKNHTDGEQTQETSTKRPVENLTQATRTTVQFKQPTVEEVINFKDAQIISSTKRSTTSFTQPTRSPPSKRPTITKPSPPTKPPTTIHHATILSEKPIQTPTTTRPFAIHGAILLSQTPSTTTRTTTRPLAIHGGIILPEMPANDSPITANFVSSVLSQQQSTNRPTTAKPSDIDSNTPSFKTPSTKAPTTANPTPTDSSIVPFETPTTKTPTTAKPTSTDSNIVPSQTPSTEAPATANSAPTDGNIVSPQTPSTKAPTTANSTPTDSNIVPSETPSISAPTPAKLASTGSNIVPSETPSTQTPTKPVVSYGGIVTSPFARPSTASTVKPLASISIQKNFTKPLYPPKEGMPVFITRKPAAPTQSSLVAEEVKLAFTHASTDKIISSMSTTPATTFEEPLTAAATPSITTINKQTTTSIPPASKKPEVQDGLSKKPVENVLEKQPPKPPLVQEEEVPKPPVENVVQRQPSKPPIENVVQKKPSKPPVENVQEEIPKPLVNNVVLRQPSKPPVENVIQKESSKSPVENTQEKIPKPLVNKVVQRQPPKAPVENVQEGTPVQSVVQKQPSRLPVENVVLKESSKPLVENTVQEEPSKPPVENVQERTPDPPVQSVVQKQPPVENVALKESSTPPVENAVQEEPSKPPVENVQEGTPDPPVQSVVQKQPPVENVALKESSKLPVENAVQEEPSKPPVENVQEGTPDPPVQSVVQKQPPVENVALKESSKPPVENAVQEEPSKPPVENAVQEEPSKPPVENVQEGTPDPPVQSVVQKQPPVENVALKESSKPPVENVVLKKPSQPPVKNSPEKEPSDPPVENVAPKKPPVETTTRKPEVELQNVKLVTTSAKPTAQKNNEIYQSTGQPPVNQASFDSSTVISSTTNLPTTQAIDSATFAPLHVSAPAEKGAPTTTQQVSVTNSDRPQESNATVAQTTPQLESGTSASNFTKSASSVTPTLTITKPSTVGPVTGEPNKQPVTETLQKLILSSTNIYEINTQLATSTDRSSASDATAKIEATPAATPAKQDGPETFATEPNLISSIEQLISQAVDNVEAPILNAQDTSKIEQLLSDAHYKPMDSVQAETATVASLLLDGNIGSGGNYSGAAEATTVEVATEAPATQRPATEPSLSLRNETVPEAFSPNKTADLRPPGKLPIKPNREDTSNIINLSILPISTTTKRTYESTTPSFIRRKTTAHSSYYTKNRTTTTAPNVSTKSEGTAQINYVAIKNEPLYKNEHIKPQKSEVRVRTTTSAPPTKNTAQKPVPTLAVHNSTRRTPTRNATTPAPPTTQKNEATPSKPLTLNATLTLPPPPNQAELRPNNVTRLSDQVSSNHPLYNKIATVTTKLKNATETQPNRPRVNATITSKPGTFQINRNLSDTQWALVSTIMPHANFTFTSADTKPKIDVQPPTPVKLSAQASNGFGLEDSVSTLDTDVYQFVELCNELSFSFWKSITTGVSAARSIFVSPFAATSLLAMVFLGARGATSGEMNEVLKLDDMVTFNPHLIFKNVTESIEVGKASGVAASVIARQLYSDRGKGKLLSFYKERARQFYDGHVEEVNFREIGDVVRRRTNLLIKKYTNGKIQEYMKDNSITARPPLAGISASIFQTDCSSASVQGRDGELYFVVAPSVKQRRLIPIPAAVWRSGFLAGYDATLDATAAAVGHKDQTVSTIFVMSGQQGISAPGDGLARLEKGLVGSAFKRGAWSRLMRSLVPRPGLELQVPRFSHKSVLNATESLRKMGLRDLFNFDRADLRGLNGVAHELHISDVLQVNNFATCGEEAVGEYHHAEIYPASTKQFRRSRKLKYLNGRPGYDDLEVADEPRDYQRSFHDPLHDPDLLALPLPLRPRQARVPDAPRLRFDRPFLFFVRHNPTGLVLHMGRFNPRLLP